MRMARRSHFVFIDRVVIAKRCHDRNLTNDDTGVTDTDLKAIADVISLKDTTQAQRSVIRSAYLAGRRDDMRKAVFAAMNLALKGRLRSAWWWTRQVRNPMRSYLRGLMCVRTHPA
jgi:hypothetical protein